MHRNLICAIESHYLSFNFGFCLDMKKLVGEEVALWVWEEERTEISEFVQGDHL